MVTSHPQVLIAGYFGFGNTGDEAILAGMLSDLRALCPGLGAVVVSGDQEGTARQHDVEAVHWSDIAELEAAVRRSDLVLVGGGGLFQDYWGLDSETYLTSRHDSISFYGGLPLLAHWAGRPCMLYAVGVGPLSTDMGRSYTRLAADLCKVVTVRDPDSAALLDTCGGGDAAPPREVRVLADPAFSLPVTASDRETAGRVLAGLGLGEGVPFVGICPRAWKSGPAALAWQQEMGTALEHFAGKVQAPFVFLPFQARPNSALEDDQAICAALGARLHSSAQVRFAPGPLPPGAAAAVLARASLVVAMRLHAVILGLSAGVPVVALSYDPKVAALMRRAGLESRTADLEVFSGASLGRQLLDAWAGREADAAAIAPLVGRMRDLARQNAHLALGLLEQGSGVCLTKERLVGGVALAQVRRACTAECELAIRREELAASRSEIAAREAELATCDEDLAAARAELAGVRCALAASLRRETEIAAELRSVYGSRSWRAARLLRRLRHLMAPTDSRRAIILRRVWSFARRLRGGILSGAAERQA